MFTCFDEQYECVKLVCFRKTICFHARLNFEFVTKIDFFDYVNENVLSQYDDEKVLHFVTFYNKNMNSTKCNYKIYDKEPLTIIKCLKH